MTRDDAPPTEPAIPGSPPPASDPRAGLSAPTPPPRGEEPTLHGGSAPPRLPGNLLGNLLGNLELLDLLGAGGMGEVWKARDPELDRLVAVKLLAPDLRGSTYDERFRREARAAAAVSHPNVAQVYFAGVHEGRLYYVMELVRGRSLAELLATLGRLSGSRAIDLLRQACEGLRAARQAGVIHRDVKPSNLMVEEESGRLKIVDFGLARRVEIDATLTRAGAVLGTPSYMSPEQVQGDDLDQRADIYSLGATFYHLVCGEPPYSAASAIEVLRRHVSAELPPVRSRNPAVPEAVAVVIERMLAKEPRARYQSYEELLDVLEEERRALDGPSARRPKDLAPASELGRSGWRRWTTLAFAGATALLVVAAVTRWRSAAVDATGAAPGSAASAAVAPMAPSGGAVAGDAAARETPARSDPSEPSDAAAPDAYSTTERTLRALAAALVDDAREALEGRGPSPAPADVEELIARRRLDPNLARDGWGSPVRLDHPPIGPPRLVSAGPDRRSRSDDDLVFVAGRLRSVPRLRGDGPQP